MKIKQLIALVILLFSIHRSEAASTSEHNVELIPLPIYSTLPNEGSTWGFMPVFLVVEKKNQRTKSIYAPSLSWNDSIRGTGTFRWYYYPTDEKNLTLVSSFSTHINWNNLFIWSHKPQEAHRFSHEYFVRYQRSIFFRFFGMGPDTYHTAETSHTRIKSYVFLREGFNITKYLNLGALVSLQREQVQSHHVEGLPSTESIFPKTPGMHGATIAGESLDLRYDSRPYGDNSTYGNFLQFTAGARQGVKNSPAHGVFELQAKTLIPQNDRFHSAIRFYGRSVTSAKVPFYFQSQLGGAYVMRGFTDERFTDQAAWAIEVEERIALFRTRIFGVVADWRADPFFGVGQVFGSEKSAFSTPQFTGGVGFRAFVQPNVLGRVDVGWAAEGVKVYVELGYPF